MGGWRLAPGTQERACHACFSGLNLKSSYQGRQSGEQASKRLDGLPEARDGQTAAWLHRQGSPSEGAAEQVCFLAAAETRRVKVATRSSSSHVLHVDLGW